MKKQAKAILALTALFALSNVPVQPLFQSVQAVQRQEQSQEEQYASLGGTLDANQSQQTLQLLGAQFVPEANIIRVNGETINKFLHDGSDINTIVYSSAYIQPMPEGHGVQVQIVTPQNILLVTPQTYQNAAITAGIHNALIRVASQQPVTGEGALAGIYALKENQGQALNPKDVQVAQQEITVVQKIEENTQINNIEINQIISDIKVEIVNLNVSGVQVTEEDLDTIVKRIADHYGITDEEVRKLLNDYAKEFNDTNAAKDENTSSQLEQSIYVPWSDQIHDVDLTLTEEDVLALGAPDFSDADIYLPIVQALGDTYYEYAQNNDRVGLLQVYSHTFIAESMSTNITKENRAAFNTIRSLILQYLNAGDTHENYTFNYMVSMLDIYAQLQSNYALLAEIVQEVGLASGLAPEAYGYNNFQQDGQVITMDVIKMNENNEAYAETFTYHLGDGTIAHLVDGEAQVLDPSFNFELLYGVKVEDNYQRQPLPMEYTIPGYTPEEEASEEPQAEESSSEEEELDEGNAWGDESKEEEPEQVEEQPAEEKPEESQEEEADQPAEESSATEEAPEEETEEPVEEETPEEEEPVEEEEPTEETEETQEPAEEAPESEEAEETFTLDLSTPEGVVAFLQKTYQVNKGDEEAAQFFNALTNWNYTAKQTAQGQTYHELSATDTQTNEQVHFSVLEGANDITVFIHNKDESRYHSRWVVNKETLMIDHDVELKGQAEEVTPEAIEDFNEETATAYIEQKENLDAQYTLASANQKDDTTFELTFSKASDPEASFTYVVTADGNYSMPIQ